MLKYVTVPVLVDDQDSNLCNEDCDYYYDETFDGFGYHCHLFNEDILDKNRSEFCLRKAK